MISIITPTYNSEQYIENCIRSVMLQDAVFEHIIVDGGSTDGTLQILKKYENQYNMRWISEKDNGMYDAISKGFKMAKGDVFAWINSDDQYLPWTLKTVQKIFENPAVKWIQGMPSYMNADGMQYMSRDQRFTPDSRYIAKGMHDGQRLGCLQQESSFWRRELFEECGGLRRELKYAGDFHLWKAFAQHAQLYTVNSVLACFRIHEDQKSANRQAYLAEIGIISPFEVFLKKIKVYKIVRMTEGLKARKYRIDVRGLE